MGNIDDQHRNTNMNDKDHLVGQLTSQVPVLLLNWSFGFTLHRLHWAMCVYTIVLWYVVRGLWYVQCTYIVH